MRISGVRKQSLGGRERRGAIEASAIRPLGLADLLVIRQELAGYELGEIAHVQNILRGERKEQVRRRVRLIEDERITEVETRREDEQAIETSERL